MVLIGNV